MKVAVVQISPVMLNKVATWQKLQKYVKEAADTGAELITWSETLIPGYPEWIARTGGATFNDPNQKKAYALYLEQAVRLDGPIVADMCRLAGDRHVMLMGGVAEAFGGSVYCTLLTIGNDGKLWGRHRKLKPTYEERLVWADGDGEGLVTYPTSIGKIGGLNCWENWIPLARAKLHAQEEFIHVSVWPGDIGLTKQIAPFMAKEGRYYVIAASGTMAGSDFNHLDDKQFPQKQQMVVLGQIRNGGSMIVAPTGETIAGPLVGEEGILYAELDQNLVLQERQNFDYSGHYSRKDILKLT